MDENVEERMYNTLKEFAERQMDEEAIAELAKRMKNELEKKHGGEDKKEH
jgi:hypothetical protein